MITREDVPCWYEVSWRGELGIVVRIHHDFVNVCEMPNKDSPLIAHMKAEHGGEDFKVDFGRDLGLGGALKYIGQSGGFLEYQAPIVLCRKYVGKCRMCSGTGKRDWSPDGECVFCNGTKEGYEYDYKEAVRVSASLGVLFNLLRFPEGTTSSSVPQLVTLNTSSGTRSFYVGGEFSVAMVNYLRAQDSGPVLEMSQAMVAASTMMEGRAPSGIYLHDFRSEVRSSGFLTVSCPGQACGLNPNHYFSDRENLGYGFCDHNVDNSMQQIMLVASVAALHDLVRATKF